MDELKPGVPDSEILAYYRKAYPHISLGQAKEVYRTWLKFRHLGALAESKRRREAADAERRRLRERVLGIEGGKRYDGSEPVTFFVNGDTQEV